MSNRIVPGVYRNIVNDVVKNVAEDFEEYGIEQSVLQALQRKWEQKLIETRVADFSRIAMAHGAAAIPLNGTRLSTGSPTSGAQSLANSSPPAGAGAFGYNMGGPSGSHLNGMGNLPGPSHLQYNAHQGLALPGQSNQMLMSGFGNGYDQIKVKQEDDILRMRGGASNEDLKPYIREDKPEPNAAGLLPGDEVIDSDLDDSDDELQNEEGDGDGVWDGDIVFCVWDKVQRVKNKWKTTFKDGMIHINGKDYLFAKCTGEFEW